MKKLLNFGLWSAVGILLTGCFLALYGYYQLNASLPKTDGTIQLYILDKPVQVTLDNYGIPTISAQSELDTYRSLGYLTARDRLFQLDLMRRKTAGRLSEIFGEAALAIDTEQRYLQLERAAKAIAKNLPDDQYQAIQAYSDGINAAIGQMHTLPFEFVLLNYQPQPWRIEDSLLVALSMFQVLSSDQESERMLTVMHETLPTSVIAFLTPDSDQYDSVLTGGSDSWRPKQPIPVKELSALLNSRHSQPRSAQQLASKPFNGLHSTLMATDDIAPGSNAWLVAGSKTTDGRAILANDMHLPLRVPNIWYRATLKYNGNLITGVTLPGLPIIVAGTNNHIAWGYTNAYVDLIDLIRLEINPLNSDQYQTPDGWENFQHIEETIHIKDGGKRTTQVRYTRWGPVSPRELLGSSVAVKWTALDPNAVNLGLLHLHDTRTLEQAITVMNQAGGPPQNAMLADATGRIAWTLMGQLPKRRGLNGATSQFWSDGKIGWEGYLSPQDLPRVIDPPSGVLATANNRTIGKQYPYQLGHGYQVGFRAWHINQRLKEMDSITEDDMLRLQLDTQTRFYRFYQNLALKALDQAQPADNPSQQVLRNYLSNWDGKAAITSKGFPVLFEFRKALTAAILPNFYEPCLQTQPDFKFSWSQKETPIRQLLDAKLPSTLPDADHYQSWNQLILEVLEQTVTTLKETHDVETLDQLTWGQVNSTINAHPFTRKLPLLSNLLDMPEQPLAGCPYCIRVVYGLFGASERMAVSPGHLEQAIMHMPTGQSGHPLSNHYADQQPFWVEGKPMPLLSNTVTKRFELVTD